MAWRDSLRAGSWRGVPFLFVEHEQEGGRRGELHEFPDRDEPWFEDLGAKAVRIRFDAVVLGAGYMAQRDALQAACDAGGPGTLIHPTLGMRTLVCETYSFRESSEEGGCAFFSFEFAEAGSILPAEAAPDTADLVAATASEARAAAPSVFAGSFSIDNLPAWVEDEGVALINRLTSSAVTAGLFLGGTGSALRAFEAGLSILPNGARALLRAPLALADAIAGLVAAVAGLGGTPLRRIAGLRGLIAAVNAAPAVLGTSTPSRARQRDNQGGFQRLVTTLAAAEIAELASEAHFASYEEAVGLRDALADEFDRYALAYADAGDDAAANTLDALRLVLVRDITARGGSLARLYRHVPATTEPALVIAHRLFDSAQLLDQAGDIVARNRVSHPGFVPGGHALEVRTNG